MQFNVAAELNKARAEIPDLRSRTDILCTEDLGSFVNKVSNYFTNKFQDITKAFTTSENRLKSVKKKDLSEQGKQVLKLRKDIKTIIETVKMADVAHKNVGAILGMKTDLLTMSKELRDATILLDAKLLKSVDTVDTLVSKVLADKEYRRSVKPTKTYNELDDLNDTLSKTISMLIDPNGTNDIVKIEKILPNLNSLKDINENLNEANSLLTYKNVKTLEDMISKLNSKVNDLYDVFVSDDIEISKKTITDLAYTVESLAELVTTSISVFYLVNQADSMLLNTVKVIKMK